MVQISAAQIREIVSDIQTELNKVAELEQQIKTTRLQMPAPPKQLPVDEQSLNHGSIATAPKPRYSTNGIKSLSQNNRECPFSIQNVAMIASIVFLIVIPCFRNALKLSALLIAISQPSILNAVSEVNSLLAVW
jgi:hypothetical protein